MTLKQLQFFKKTAELENISKAADELYIAQPALSKTIKDLENELGYSLFERNGKKIFLNHNGEILYKYVLQIQSELSHLDIELKEANDRKLTSVYILVRVASKLLPEILSSFYRKSPSANLRIDQMNQVTKHLQDYDIIVDSTDTKIEDSTHKNELLLEEKILLALPTTHPLARKDKIVLSDLEGQPCCLLNDSSSLGKMVRSRLDEKHMTPNIIFESDNPHMIRDFLRQNLAYSFVPETTWQLKKDYPNLMLKEIEDMKLYRYIYLTYGHNGYISQATKEFAIHIIDYFKKGGHSDDINCNCRR